MSPDRKIEFQGHAQLRSKFEVSLRYMIALSRSTKKRGAPERRNKKRKRRKLFLRGRDVTNSEATARFLDFGVGRIDEDTVVSPQNRISHNPIVRDASRLPQLLSFLGDSRGIFLSHPWDFAPVFTTEVGRTINPALEFVKRNRHVGHLFNRQC